MFPAIIENRSGRKPHPPKCGKRKRGKKIIDDCNSNKDIGNGIEVFKTVNSIIHDEGRTAGRLQVQLWMDSFNEEKANYASLTTCAEIFYARVLRATEALPEPNVLRTATCMMLLQQLSSLFTRYQPLMLSLCHQLEGAIFIKTDEEILERIPTEAEEDIEALLPSRYVRQTYFNAYVDVLEKYRCFQNKTAALEDHMQRQMKVLERAIGTWQKAFIEKVFYGWKGYTTKQRRLRKKYKLIFANSVAKFRKISAWRTWCETVDTIKWKTATTGVESVGTKLERLTDELHKMEIELRAKQQVIEDREARIESLQSEIQTIKSEKMGAYEKYVDMQSNTRKLCSIINEWLIAARQNKADFLARNTFNNVLYKPGEGLPYLVDWANELIFKKCGEEGKIYDFTDDVKTGKPYVYLLRSMAPAQCSEGWLIRCLTEADTVKRCEAVLKQTSDLGIDTPLKPEDIIKGTYHLNYYHLVLCFRRFAIPRPAVLNGDRNGCESLFDLDALEVASANLKDPPQPEKIPPDQWSKRWQSTYETNSQWLYKVASVNTSLELEMIQSLRRGGNVQLVQSRRQEEQQNQLCLVPLGSFADLLASMRGSGTSQDMYERVVKILKQHYLLLRKVFKYYCVADVGRQVARDDTTLDSMAYTEFSKLLVDCKLTDKKIKPNLLTIASRLQDERPPGSSSGVGVGQERLTPKEYTLALIHVAARKYTDEDLADRIQKLIHEHIEPHAKSSAADQFKQEIYLTQNQSVLSVFRDELTKLYNHFSGKNQSNKPNANGCIDLNEWMAFIKAANMTDSSLTIVSAKSIFHAVQDDADCDSTLTMNLSEFMEAVASLTYFRFPSPFEPFPQRLHRFLKILLSNF